MKNIEHFPVSGNMFIWTSLCQPFTLYTSEDFDYFLLQQALFSLSFILHILKSSTVFNLFVQLIVSE